jgi:hypothetical protein
VLYVVAFYVTLVTVDAEITRSMIKQRLCLSYSRKIEEILKFHRKNKSFLPLFLFAVQIINIVVP